MHAKASGGIDERRSRYADEPAHPRRRIGSRFYRFAPVVFMATNPDTAVLESFGAGEPEVLLIENFEAIAVFAATAVEQSHAFESFAYSAHFGIFIFQTQRHYSGIATKLVGRRT